MHREVVFEMSSGKSIFVKLPNPKTKMNEDEILYEIKDYLQKVDDWFYCIELDFYGMNPETVLVNKNNIEKIFIYEY